MTLKFVDSVPKRATRSGRHWRKKNPVMDMVCEFVRGPRKIALVCFDREEEYSSIFSLMDTLRHTIKYCGLEDEVRVVKRGDDVYLVKH